MLHAPRRARLSALLLLAAAVIGPGCSGEGDPHPPDASALRARFPAIAGRVLSTGEAFVSAGGGFTPQDASARRFTVELPRRAAAPIRFQAGAITIAVRELEVEGEGEIVEQAIAYRRAGGASYWAAVPGGVEEWLHLAGTRRSEAAAVWEIEGASPRQAGDAIQLVDAEGAAALTVSAPAAFAADGRAVAARVTARGARIELFVDAEGEGVLVDPLWTQTGSLAIGRTRHASALLPTGKVLVCGGAAVNYCELYDHSAGSYAMGASMSFRRQDLTATALPSGKVVIIGGALGTSQPLQAEIYDPIANSFTLAGAMSATRQLHTATLLQSGKVLVCGGIPPGTTGSAYASCETFDPTTGQFSLTGSMSIPRAAHAATLLQNGKVLASGGNTVSGASLVPTAAAEIYDPTLGTWSTTGSMATARQYATATLLQDGRVLVAGGNGATITGTAEIYDPMLGTWSPTGSLAYPRWEHMAVRLGSGKVLVVGGAGISPPLPGNQTETWSPITGTWSFAGSLATSHALGTLTLLSGGSALLAGGQTFVSEVYAPQSPNGTPCTDAGECTSGVCADGVCCVTACVTPCNTCAASKGAVADGICTPLSGTPCSDGDACSIGDVCSAGQCLSGTPKQCVALSPCHVPGTCDPLTGLCDDPKKPEGAPCTDGDACTQGDSCSGGMCVSGAPVVCMPPDSCHFPGSCNPATGLCAPFAKDDGAACDDGDACTQSDTCLAGTCIGASPVECPPPDQCHSANVCDKATGACNPVAKPDGSPCSDSDVCTTGDQCVAGACQPGTPVVCPPPADECHDQGSCNAAVGACSKPVKADGTPCKGGACKGGVCEQGASSSSSSSASSGAASSSGSIGEGGGGSGGGAPASGCSCRAAGEREGTDGLAWLVAVGVIGARTRRRSRPRVASRD